MTEWSLAGVHDVIASAVPDRDMVVWGDVRRTYADVRQRTRGLAAFFAERGLGVRRERSELERWECGQARVAVVLSNCPEYVETMFGAYRARAVPFNVNHHYTAVEVAALLAQMGADAVVYHRRLAPLLASDPAVAARVLIDVDDGSGVEPLAGSTNFEVAVATDGPSVAGPSPDDLYMVCTGGTTGKPKGVLWRQADIYVAAMNGADDATEATIAAGAANGDTVWFAAPPLMHAAAQWTAFSGFHAGATVVLHDDSARFDARTILETIQRERVNVVSMVGDAYARPIVEELGRRTYDLTSLQMIGIGGAVTSDDNKQALLDLVPHLLILDGYGSSETGGMAFGASTKGATTHRFAPGAGAAVLSADRTRFLSPGDDEIGWTARTGRVALGYLDDPEKTQETFPMIDGGRVTVPGDRARYDADGQVVVLGRDSMVVNTGGEKVFVEEVEQALLRHPAIEDALAVGRPSERFGQEVVALVQLHDGETVTPTEVREFVAASIARFKAPRAVLVCDRIGRHPSGKADYAWARRVAPDAEGVS